MPYSLHKPEKFLYRESEFLINVTSLVQNKSLKHTFYARIKQADSYPMSLKVKVNDFTAKTAKYRNDYLVKGKLTRHRFGKSYFYTLWLKNNAYIKQFPIGLWDKFLRSLNYRLLYYFKRSLPAEPYQFVSSVFLGRREIADKAVKSIFIKAGVAHLFAISGLHVGLLSAVLLFALKIFRFKFRARLLAAIVFMFVYAMLVGARPSVVRATIMCATFGAGFFLRRRVSPFDSLSIAGLVCLFLNPIWVFDVGFQLSFLAVFGIILGFSMFNIDFSHNNAFVIYFKGIFFSTLFVTIIITPVISYYFGRIYFLGVISNLILIPLFTLVLVTSFIFAICFFAPLISQLLAEALSFFIFLFIKAALGLSKLSFLMVVFSLSFKEIVVYYCLLFAAVVFLYHCRSRKKRIVFQ